MCLCSPNVARQRFGKHLQAATYTHNNKAVKRRFFYKILVLSNSQRLVTGKYEIISFHNFCFDKN